MRIHIILSHPSVPENIGFVCRALKTMGFNDLILINAESHLSEKTLKTAYGSHDILQSARVVSNLSEAIEHMDLVIGTTAKNRVGRHDYYEPAALVSMLQSKVSIVNDLALVFGSERNGLSKEEIALCDILTTIPLKTSHPSLNLAQAVLIYVYELSAFDHIKSTSDTFENPVTDQKRLKSEAVDLLDFLEVNAQPSLYQRLKDRLASASSEDTSLLLALSRFLRRKLKN